MNEDKAYGQEPFIAVRSNRLVEKVYLRDILYIARYGRKIELCTHMENFSFYGDWKALEEHLPSPFTPVSRSLYVNLEHISSLKNSRLFFDTGLSICLAREPFSRMRRVFYLYLKTKEISGNG